MSKGKMLHVETALRRSTLCGHSQEMLLSHVERVALLSAERLSRSFPKHRIYGVGRCPIFASWGTKTCTTASRRTKEDQMPEAPAKSTLVGMDTE
ncbi:hypothetical protein [Brevibacillus massiliensis]|uniref:hypothetical protein n=1 Tax=Brevibacillus massiliensis TaxID=1118054 RepID=UPI0003724AF3|nr:hypothetical protein [Brevibacillus massiliensis]